MFSYKALSHSNMSEADDHQKLTVSELKQLVDRPEVVEWFDCDARDPRLLVNIKSYRK